MALARRNRVAFAALKLAAPGCSGPPADICAGFPGAYASLGRDLADLPRADAGRFAAQIRKVGECYPRKPYFSEAETFASMRHPAFVEARTLPGDGVLLVFQVPGVTHFRLAYQLSATGRFERVYHTAQPYQRVTR